MATTKKAIKFYADKRVEAHLDGISPQLRSHWINQTLLEAIEKKPKNKSDLAALHAYLKKLNKDSDTFEGDLLDLLNEFYKTK